MMVLRASKKIWNSRTHGVIPIFCNFIWSVFNHFFRAQNETDGGDLVLLPRPYLPGIYARAFLEGRLTEDQLNNFRQEIGGKGLSSYPHPKLMPEFCSSQQFLWVWDHYQQFTKLNSWNIWITVAKRYD